MKRYEDAVKDGTITSPPPPEPGRSGPPGISKHLHRHQCSKCGRVWAHEGVFPIGNRSAENIAMHECMCGHIEWDVLGAEPPEEERLARELWENLKAGRCAFHACGCDSASRDAMALNAIRTYADAQSRAAVERAEKERDAEWCNALWPVNPEYAEPVGPEEGAKHNRLAVASILRARVKQELERIYNNIHDRLAAIQKEQG